MSALRATTAPELPLRHEKERHLKAVPGSGVKHKRRSPLFLSLTGVIGVLVILAAQLGLNLSVSGGAYEISELAAQQRELSRAERALQIEVDMLASPQNLAAEAATLGMVQNSRPAYLDLEDSKLVGSISQSTSKPKENLIGNSALSEMRLPEQAADKKPVVQEPNKVVENNTAVPVVWEGKLSAPQTH